MDEILLLRNDGGRTMDLPMIKLIRQRGFALPWLADLCGGLFQLDPYSQPAGAKHPFTSTIIRPEGNTGSQPRPSPLRVMPMLWRISGKSESSTGPRMLLVPGHFGTGGPPSASRCHGSTPTDGTYVTRVRTGHDCPAIARPNQRQWHDPARFTSTIYLIAQESTSTTLRWKCSYSIRRIGR